MKNEWKSITKGLAVGVALAIGAQVFAAWSEPTTAPPGGNPEAPINTSVTGQVKKGNLVLNFSNVAQNALLLPYGAMVIGDATPETAPGKLKVDVEGKTGSTQFCDENGVKCFTVENLCTQLPKLCK